MQSLQSNPAVHALVADAQNNLPIITKKIPVDQEMMGQTMQAIIQPVNAEPQAVVSNTSQFKPSTPQEESKNLESSTIKLIDSAAEQHMKHSGPNIVSRFIRKTKLPFRRSPPRSALQRSLEIYVPAMMSSLGTAVEDDALAEFFEFIPPFFSSDQVDNLEERLVEEFRIKFSPALYGFLDRTFSSDSVSEPIKRSRLKACLNATHAVLGSDGVSQILSNIFNGNWPELLQSIEMADSLRRWNQSTDDEFAPYVRRIVTQVIANVRERNERWISLTKAECGVPDHVLRDDIRHGDSALLSLLIFVTCQAFSSGSWTPFTLSSLTRFDIRNTRPELQHEFCDLWNDIVREALRVRPDSTAVNILREIRHAFLGLHQGADFVPSAFSSRTHHFDPVLANPLSYRVCNIVSHRRDWTQAPREPVLTHLTVAVTPTRTSPGSSTAATIGDSPSPSPRPIPMEIQRNPGKADIVIISPDSNIIQTAPQQADEADVVLQFPSSITLATMQPDYTPHRTHAFRSTVPTVPSPVSTTQQFDNYVRPEDTMIVPYDVETEEDS
jgi:hypothetical protein